MMCNVEIAGLWELGWSAPLTESVQWEMVLREFGVERLNMTPVSGIDERWVHEYPTLDELLADRSHLVPVFVDEGGAVELKDFDHPPNVLYVFGKVTFSPFSAIAGEHTSIRIDSVKPGMLLPHQAAALVLYDRFSK
jgi:hypothetical protein